MGTLNFKLKISGIENEIPVSVKNVKAKKPVLSIKAAKVSLAKDQDESVIAFTKPVCTYKGSDGRVHELQPKSVTIDKCKKVEAAVDESDPAMIRISKLTGKSGSIKAVLTFEGGMKKNVTINVKQAK